MIGVDYELTDPPTDDEDADEDEELLSNGLEDGARRPPVRRSPCPTTARVVA
jgi:hypothetical protein